jgi:hypothetical protein
MNVSADDLARLNAPRVVTCLALLSGIMLSLNLWFPTKRTFPRAPLINFSPQSFVPTVEYLLGILLIAALVALLFAKRRMRYLIAAVATLSLLISLDQTRLQPWVYQYTLFFVVLALHERRRFDERVTKQALSALRLIVAALYVWSGVQKLNFSFGHEVMPRLLDFAQSYLPLTQTWLSALGICAALAEAFTGCGLLFRRTRKLCVLLALVMHFVILGLLVGRGYNSVVWAWNVALMLIVVILFWRDDTSARQALPDFRAGYTPGLAAQTLAAACAVLPALSFWGRWDMNLSGALYSGRTAVGVVRVDSRVYAQLPETAKRLVFTTKGGERMLPLFEWTMAELNVPPYPEPRVFRQAARELCESAEDKSGVELIVRGKPAVLGGGYEVTRANCEQLDE